MAEATTSTWTTSSLAFLVLGFNFEIKDFLLGVSGNGRSGSSMGVGGMVLTCVWGFFLMGGKGGSAELKSILSYLTSTSSYTACSMSSYEADVPALGTMGASSLTSSLTSLVGVAARLAMDIECRFMFGALGGGVFTDVSGIGVGGGGSSGVGHVTMLRIGDGGGGKVEACTS